MELSLTLSFDRTCSGQATVASPRPHGERQEPRPPEEVRMSLGLILLIILILLLIGALPTWPYSSSWG
jgi:hypothetical protein